MTALEAAVLAALAPRGARERLRLALGGGYTPLQVYERLSTEARDALAGEGDPVVAARHGVERVRAALGELERAGRVWRGTREMTVALGNKGPRDVVVDVFRRV